MREICKEPGKVVQSDEERSKDHPGNLVWGSEEKALNAMLEAETDTQCGAGRARSKGR